ncbi:MAG: glycosyltransferase family 61 protein [Acidimicrobiia bacterium]
MIDPAFTTTRPLPKTIEPEVHPGFGPLCSFPVPERALVKIPNARIRGTVGLVILPSGEFAGELVALTPAGRRSMLGAEPSYHRPLPSQAREMRGNFCRVLGLGVGNYYHWGHDVITGLRGVPERLPPDTRLIVPETMKPFQVETLGLLGLDDHPRVPFPAGAFWELENLYVVTPRQKTQIDSNEPLRWFRTAAMGRYGIREVKPARRLYLTRRNDGHWRATNEHEMERFLAELGFETVDPGALSFRGQIELFGQAACIVGTGTGLFNMVFSPPGTKVLQFQDTRHMVHAGWTEAAAMGFDYHYFLCDSVPNPRRPIGDIHVPIAKLRASLREMAVS